MTNEELAPALECLIFTSQRPLSLAKLCQVLEFIPPDSIKDALNILIEEYQDPRRGLELVEVAGGYQFRTKPGYAFLLSRLNGEQAFKVSRAALETLAIVAYKQPVTRIEIEALRGVEVTGLLHLLLEKGLIRVTGKKPVTGRPFLYGTTRRFLEIFGLQDIKDLPTATDWEELRIQPQM